MSVIWIFPIKLGYEIWLFEVWKHLKSGLFEGRISNDTDFKESEFSYGYSYTVGIWNPETFEIPTFRRSDFKWLGLSYGYGYSLNHSKTGTFKIQTFLSRFQMFFDKMASICPGLGFLITDPIQNLDHSQPNLFNPD